MSLTRQLLNVNTSTRDYNATNAHSELTPSFDEMGMSDMFPLYDSPHSFDQFQWDSIDDITSPSSPTMPLKRDQAVIEVVASSNNHSLHRGADLNRNLQLIETFPQKNSLMTMVQFVPPIDGHREYYHNLLQHFKNGTDRKFIQDGVVAMDPSSRKILSQRVIKPEPMVSSKSGDVNNEDDEVQPLKKQKRKKTTSATTKRVIAVSKPPLSPIAMKPQPINTTEPPQQSNYLQQQEIVFLVSIESEFKTIVQDIINTRSLPPQLEGPTIKYTGVRDFYLTILNLLVENRMKVNSGGSVITQDERDDIVSEKFETVGLYFDKDNVSQLVSTLTEKNVYLKPTPKKRKKVVVESGDDDNE